MIKITRLQFVFFTLMFAFTMVLVKEIKNQELYDFLYSATWYAAGFFIGATNVKSPKNDKKSPDRRKV